MKRTNAESEHKAREALWSRTYCSRERERIVLQFFNKGTIFLLLLLLIVVRVTGQSFVLRFAQEPLRPSSAWVRRCSEATKREREAFSNVRDHLPYQFNDLWRISSRSSVAAVTVRDVVAIGLSDFRTPNSSRDNIFGDVLNTRLYGTRDSIWLKSPEGEREREKVIYYGQL